MPIKDPENYGLVAWVCIAAISIWGGVVRYILDMQQNKTAWNWAAATAQVIVSGFTGVLGGLICIQSGASIYITLAGSGMSGAMGSIALMYFWQRFSGISQQ